jgi:hypothetical protein
LKWTGPAGDEIMSDPGNEREHPKSDDTDPGESVIVERTPEEQRWGIVPIPPLYLSDRYAFFQILSVFVLLNLSFLILVGIIAGRSIEGMLYAVAVFPAGLFILFCLDPQTPNWIVIIDLILGYAVYLFLIGLAFYRRTKRALLMTLCLYALVVLLNLGAWILIIGTLARSMH